MTRKIKVDALALKKREERQRKDLDGDGERGESVAHRKKVFGGGQISGRSNICTKCGKKMPCGCA